MFPRFYYLNFMKRNSNFWVIKLKYSWRPFNWCINCQSMTDIDKANVISALQHKSKFNFKLSWKKYFGLAGCRTHEDLSIDVSITNVGLILTKLRLISALRSKIQFRTFLKKKIRIFGFQCCSTRENLSTDVSVRTDPVLENSNGNMSAHKNF